MAGKVKVKMKTDRGVAKRFKKTGSGHYKCRHQNLRHILTKKTAKRKRNLRNASVTLRIIAGGYKKWLELSAVLLPMPVTRKS